MTKAPLDCLGGIQVTMHACEFATWECLCMYLRIFYVWDHGSKKEAQSPVFGSHRCMGGTSSSLVDCSFVNDRLGEWSGLINFLACIALLDHELLVMLAIFQEV